MRFLKSLLAFSFFAFTADVSASAESGAIRIYSWQNHALCGEFDSNTGVWIQQVDMKLCGGSEHRLYTWQGRRLCGEFTLRTQEWVGQVDLKNCGGSYFKTYTSQGALLCGEFTSQDHQWVGDASASPTGNGDIPNCNPPEMGGACYCL